MRENERISLREMLGQMTTEQLDQMFHAEMQKEQPDPNAVRLILDILEEREKDFPPDSSPQAEAAWAQYQRRVEEGFLRPRKRRKWLWRTGIAAMMAVALFAVVPQDVQADGFVGVLSRWKSDLLEFIIPGEIRVEQETAYQTDHPGLQQVYDTAVAQGIEEPAIPEWMLEEYTLVQQKVVENPKVKRITLLFSDAENTAVFEIKKYEKDVYRQFFRDDTYSEVFEVHSIAVDITRNQEKWVAVWQKENVEYSFTVDCQEETLKKVLSSIYVTEEN